MRFAFQHSSSCTALQEKSPQTRRHAAFLRKNLKFLQNLNKIKKFQRKSKMTPQTAAKFIEIRPKRPKIPAFGRKSRKPCSNLREHEAQAKQSGLPCAPHFSGRPKATKPLLPRAATKPRGAALGWNTTESAWTAERPSGIKAVKWPNDADEARCAPKAQASGAPRRDSKRVENSLARTHEAALRCRKTPENGK